MVREVQKQNRNSIFKGKLKNIFFITHVTIKLSKSKKLNLSYNEVNEYFRNKKVDYFLPPLLRGWLDTRFELCDIIAQCCDGKISLTF